MKTGRQATLIKGLSLMLPERRQDIDRFTVLMDAALLPTVAVIGKYNHGKSQLLNALIGQDIFVVSDSRQTVKLDDVVHSEVRWVDTPGLDADVASEDDRLALQGAWLESDARLFVHAAKEGELDQSELSFLQQLREDDAASQRQTLFVLTQTDQLASQKDVEEVMSRIQSQTPGMEIFPVSSSLYQQGQKGAKSLLVNTSGVPFFREILTVTIAKIAQRRSHEIAAAAQSFSADVALVRQKQETKSSALHRKQSAAQDAFKYELGALIQSLSKKLAEA
jgi:tRNA U34 5-carboxymethylaminomethyl modifying GTPase MnmE/TrmE